MEHVVTTTVQTFNIWHLTTELACSYSDLPEYVCHANWTTVTMKQCAASIENSAAGKYCYITDMDN